MNSPRSPLSLSIMEIHAARTIPIRVTPKQNSTNLVSQTWEKSELARSSNSRTGSAALNTNWFIRSTKGPSISPTFLNNTPSTISIKIGIVAFKLNIRFSTSVCLHSFVHYPCNNIRSCFICQDFQTPPGLGRKYFTWQLTFLTFCVLMESTY